MELFKDVEVDGHAYQVGRFSARVGSWILVQIMTKMLPGGLDESIGEALPTGRVSLTEAEFDNIQGHCLSVCREYQNGMPVPVFVLPNTFALKDLEYDLASVMALTVHAISFNIGSFFQGGGLKLLTQSLPSLPTSK